MSRRPRRPDRGFTLLEILAALVVLSVLAALVYGVVRIGSRTWESGRARIDEAETMRIGWTFLQRALTNSVPEPERNVETPAVHFIGLSSAVEFVAELPAYLASGLQVVRVQIEPGADERSDQLVLRSAPLPRDDDTDTGQSANGPQPQEAVLAEGVADLSIRYFGRVGDDDGPTWQPEWRQQANLPTLVRIDVALADGHSWPVLVAHLRAAGSGGKAAARTPAVRGQRMPPGGWQQYDRGAQ